MKNMTLLTLWEVIYPFIRPRVSIEPRNEVNDDVNNEMDQQHQIIATISVIVLVAT